MLLCLPLDPSSVTEMQPDAPQAPPAMAEADPGPSLAWLLILVASTTDLQEIVQTLPCATSAPAPSSATPPLQSASGSRQQVSLPEEYYSEPERILGFFTIYSLYFLQHPTTDYDKIATLLSRLGGWALQWAVAIWEKLGEETRSYERFVLAMKLVFDHHAAGQQGSKWLFEIQQRRQTAADYTLEFCILLAESDWTVASLCAAFCCGLSSTLQKVLVGRDYDDYEHPGLALCPPQSSSVQPTDSETKSVNWYLSCVRPRRFRSRRLFQH